jgi:hypothetical protein
MKKIIYLVFFLPILLTAGLDISKINKTLSSMTSSKEQLKFFNANNKIKMKKKLTFTSREKANIILFPKVNTSSVSKISIVGSYSALRDNKKYIGAIYLRKERTQIVFIKERLENNSLTLPSKYDKYIITECQLNPLCLLKL